MAYAPVFTDHSPLSEGHCADLGAPKSLLAMGVEDSIVRRRRFDLGVPAPIIIAGHGLAFSESAGWMPAPRRKFWAHWRKTAKPAPAQRRTAWAVRGSELSAH